MKHNPPSHNGDDHRDELGRFTKGNPGGPGNPFGATASKLRTAIMNSVSEEDIKAIFEALLKKAKAGDVLACREVLDRLVGKAPLLVEGAITGVSVLTEEQQRRADEIVCRIDAIDD